MSDDGYTLAEMLAALLIIGLAMAGLTQAIRVLGLFQSSAARLSNEQRALRIAEADLTRLVDGQGPFRSTEPTFTGGAASFQFDCSPHRRCGARLETGGETLRLLTTTGGEQRSARLPAAAGGHFTYVGTGVALTSWPPAGERQTLRAINLVQVTDRGEAQVLTTRIWVEQNGDCAFDAIAQDCREMAR